MAKIGDHENQLRALREAKLKSSRGGVESRHTVQRSAAKPGNTGIITSQSEQSEGRGRSGPQTSRRSAVDDGIHQTPAGVASGPREAKRKTGRPLAKDADKTLGKLRPWVALGMSESTWYRRQAEQRAKEKQ